MCGIVGGIQGPGTLLKLLSGIQHRGYDEAGVATEHWCWRAKNASELAKKEMGGTMGVAHVRYATNKDSPSQPIFDGYAFAFNGEVRGGDTLRMFEAAKSFTLSEVIGAYCFALYSPEHKTVFAGRDPFGFHPLYYSQELKCVSSETCADLSIDWEPVSPGTVIDCSNGKVVFTIPISTLARCFFEYVYFSNVSSEFDGLSVYSVRRLLGEKLAKAEDVSADIVMPVPDSGIAASEAFAEYLCLPCRSGIFRNRNSDRTFISENGVDSKYNIIPDAIDGTRVFLIDDSIVRGKTLNQLVPKLKQYALEIHVRVTCPPIRHACKYGINITGPGVKTIKGADSVRFLSVDDLDWTNGLCKACVSGFYPES